MPPRRHLPVLPAAPAAPPPEAPSEPPPWHWIPLGSVVSLVALIPIGPAVQRVMRAALEVAYPAGATAAQLAALRRASPGRGLAAEVLAVLVPVADAQRLYAATSPTFADLLLGYPGGLELELQRDASGLRDVAL